MKTSRDECLEAAQRRVEEHFAAKRTQQRSKKKTSRHSIVCTTCKRNVFVHVNGRIYRHYCPHGLWCRGNSGDVPWDVCAICHSETP